MFVEEGKMSSNKPRSPAIIPEGKLDGTNYPLWKFKMMAILQSFDLWDTAIGNDPEPQPTRDSMGNATSPADPTVLGWKHKNADTLCTILLSVQDSVLTLIQHVSKACKAWELLHNQ